MYLHFDICSSYSSKCEMLVQTSGEEDLKIDVSYIAYRFFRGSIDNSDYTDPPCIVATVSPNRL